MNERELIEKWLAVFGKGVDKKLLEDHVTSYGNLLWHLFTWGNVSCLKGDEARKAFDDLQYEEAIRFYDGYSNHIQGISVVNKITAKKVASVVPMFSMLWVSPLAVNIASPAARTIVVSLSVTFTSPSNM